MVRCLKVLVLARALSLGTELGVSWSWLDTPGAKASAGRHFSPQSLEGVASALLFSKSTRVWASL